MPVQPTYPGVYVQEISSGVRTITGVATSITAFVGTAKRGPVDDPIVINSFSDFERLFGGLSLDSPLSYALHDFYLNGGSQAVVVRVYFDAAGQEAMQAAQAVAAAVSALTGKSVTGDALLEAARTEAGKYTTGLPASAAQFVVTAVENAVKAQKSVSDIKAAANDAVTFSIPSPSALIRLTSGTGSNAQESLVLEAVSPGTWGNKLEAYVDHTVAEDAADTLGVSADDLFNLYVYDGTTGTIEQFRNVTIRDSARRVDKVLLNESGLVSVQRAAAGTRPDVSDQALRAQLSDPAKKRDAEIQLRKSTFDLASKRAISVAAADQGRDSAPASPEAIIGSEDLKTGLYALEKTDLFNLLCIPPATLEGNTDTSVYQEALSYCVRRRAMLIVDPPAEWAANAAAAASNARDKLGDLGLSGTDARNAALYFPRLKEANPLRSGQVELFVPCGAVAGIMARTDSQRGVWKAPAGIDAAVNGIRGLEVNFTDAENGMLNPLGINCLRSFPVTGRVVWGARTLRGADRLADDYKYIPVRRLVLFLEESLYRGTQWAVFEPNDEPLWSQLRLNVGAFMHNLFRQGAFQGQSPRDAYFVKCDKETTTPNDVNLGIVNVIVGFAPLKPAEFVIISIQQIASALEI